MGSSETQDQAKTTIPSARSRLIVPEVHLVIDKSLKISRLPPENPRVKTSEDNLRSRAKNRSKYCVLYMKPSYQTFNLTRLQVKSSKVGFKIIESLHGTCYFIP
jgi:hypothetical protein